LDIDVGKHPVWIRDNIAVLSEETRFYEDMTPRKYLNMFGKLMLMKKPDRLKSLNDAADLADLRSFLDKRIAFLSQGERQRVSLARVLMADCPLMFLDEPFEGVDIVHRKAVREHLKDYVTKGNTIFFTSHNLLEAEHIVDRFGFINQGRLIAVGTAQELKERYLVPSYILQVSDPEKARDVLNGQLPLQFLKVVEGQVVVTLHRRGDAPKVAKILVESGVDIFEMRTTGTMEEVFERIAKGDVS
jgi:ABC-type multidrug transport system ATPase subunit